MNFFRKSLISFLMQMIARFLQYSNKNIPVLYPFENFKVAWDIFHFLIIIFLFFYIPIDVCFGSDFPQILHLLFTGFFTLDMILNFNTAYFYNGFMMMNRRKIAKNYMNNYFIYDFVTSFVFIIDYSLSNIESDYVDSGVRFFKFIFFLRIITFRSLYNRLIEKFRLSMRVHMSLIELVNLLFISIMILHLFASFWFLIASHHIEDPNYLTWLTHNKLVDETTFTQYSYSLYWSAVTMMTVGYGDISATNTEETLFCIFTIVVGCMVFAYIINSIGMIVGEINRENILFK